MPDIVEGANFRNFKTNGSMGVVVDVTYVGCYWPDLDRPVALFADGSRGIKVQGPPTPRNILFPDDTEFLGVRVNDAPLFEPPRWRTSTVVMTPNDAFAIRKKQLQDVDDEDDVTKTVEVEPGVFADVKYRKRVRRRRMVDTNEPIGRARAKRIASGQEQV